MIVPPYATTRRPGSEPLTFIAACPGCGSDAEWVHKRGPLLFVDGLPHQPGQYEVRCGECG